MAVEYSKIVKAKYSPKEFPKLGISISHGISIFVEEKKHKLIPGSYNGVVWLDVHTAMELGMLPHNWHDLTEKQLDWWLKSNLKDKEFTIVSMISQKIIKEEIKIGLYLAGELEKILKNYNDFLGGTLDTKSRVDSFVREVDEYQKKSRLDDDFTRLVMHSVFMIFKHISEIVKKKFESVVLEEAPKPKAVKKGFFAKKEVVDTSQDKFVNEYINKIQKIIKQYNSLLKELYGWIDGKLGKALNLDLKALEIYSGQKINDKEMVYGSFPNVKLKRTNTLFNERISTVVFCGYIFKKEIHKANITYFSY